MARLSASIAFGVTCGFGGFSPKVGQVMQETRSNCSSSLLFISAWTPRRFQMCPSLIQSLAKRKRVMRFVAAGTFRRDDRRRIQRLVRQILEVALRRGERVRLRVRDEVRRIGR